MKHQRFRSVSHEHAQLPEPHEGDRDVRITTGRVVRKLRDRCEVLIEDRVVSCSLSGALCRQAASPGAPPRGRSAVVRAVPGHGTARGAGGSRPGRSGEPSESGRAVDPVAVGDDVRVRLVSDAAVVIEVLPRRNRLTRRAAGPIPVEQVMAANCDLMVAVFAAAQPAPHWPMLDRMLIEAEAAGISALVCLTKVDLAERESLEGWARLYESIGYPVVFTSCVHGSGLSELASALAGRTSVFVGKSGVGKTSLIRTLFERTGPAGSERPKLAVGDVSAKTGKGKHTTSEPQMILLPSGGALIDTPGVREFGLWDVSPSGMAGLFPEMRAELGQCRFGNGCTHAHEPDCGIKRAVREGRIDPRRYRSFLKLTGRPDDGCAAGDAGSESTEGGAAPNGSPGRTYKHSAKNDRPEPAGSEPFVCGHCGQAVAGEAPGTAHRNHCPGCLWSLHVDSRPGDRAAGCLGRMEPIAVSVRPDGEWALVHRCRECGAINANRIAGDDNGMLLMSLAVRPLARPPFPLERMGGAS